MTVPVPDGVINSRNLCSQAVVERVLGDESVTSIKIYNTIQSDNYSPGSAGWSINRVTGSCEFQDATIRGTLSASDITSGTMSADYISGGTIDATNVTVTNLNASNIASGTLAAARIATNSLAVDKISGGTYGNSDITFSSGSDLISSNYDDTPGTEAGWRIDGNGNSYFNDVTARGTIYASAGELGTLDIDGTLTLVAGGEFYSASTGQHLRIRKTDPDAISFWDGSTQYGVIGISPSNNYQLISQNGGELNLTASSTGQLTISCSGAKLYLTSSNRFESSATGGISIYTGTGSASTPAYAFYGDTDTGMYRISADLVGIAAGGTLQAASGNATNKGWRIEDGSVSYPGLRFINDADTGVYMPTAGQIAISCSGTQELLLGSTGFLVPNVYNTDQAGGNTVYADSDGRLHINTSTLRHKQNVTEAPQLAAIKLTPITYTKHGTAQIGFAAEHLTGQDTRLGIYDNEGLVENYQDRGVMAILAAKVNRLEEHCGL